MAREVFGVFSGGGVKGAAFVGAIQEAERRGIHFAGWGGTSAGSIVATLLACGYSSAELGSRLNSISYAEFFRVSKRRLLFFNRYRGMVNPTPIYDWLRKQIEEKFPGLRRVYFKNLRDDQHLKIVGANISNQEIEIFSKRTSPDMEIASAVLASCSFPLVFPPVPRGPDMLVDGGVLSNFPMWLFDDEKETDKQLIPVLGFALISKPKDHQSGSILTHARSIFDSILVAQDRIQEKYMDTARSANVIRIDVEDTPTFSTTQTQEENEKLVRAGKDAASRYFETASPNYGERISIPSGVDIISSARAAASAGDHRRAISIIARQHLLHGGVARDDGLLSQRIFVRYYIDLMEAATNHEKLDILAHSLARKVESIGSFDRVIGIKKGNMILAYTVARLLGKPISLFKTDMSYKMGIPFDGTIVAGESVVVVDDIASDGAILLNAIRHLNFYHAVVRSVVTLIERTEGNAATKIMQDRNVPVRSICRADDAAIERLIRDDVPFS